MNAALTLPEPQASNLSAMPLVTVDPVKYATAIYDPFNAELELAITEEGFQQQVDITTSAGYEAITKRRAIFRELRVRAEKTRKERKAPILEIGRLLDAKYEEFERKVKPYELAHDAKIKAEDQRKADIKAEKERQEAARIAAIHERIDAIRSAPLSVGTLRSDQIRPLITTLSDASIELSEYAEFTGMALQARTAALEQMEALFNAAQAREAEAERLRLEREELDRQRAEQQRIAAEAQAELQRQQAELQRQADEQRQKLLAEQQAAEEKAAADRRLLNDQRAAVERQERALQERQAAAVAAEAKAEPMPTPAVEPAPALVADKPTDIQAAMCAIWVLADEAPDSDDEELNRIVAAIREIASEFITP